MQKEPVLIIMVAGMGSRYGGLKQMDPVGSGGEAILDFSIYDAMMAGFNKVIFVIKHEIEEDFKKLIEGRVDRFMQVEYAFQELDDIPKGYEIPEGSRISKGTNIVNILPIEQGERVSAMIQVPDVEGEGYLCMVTRNGVIKRTLASVYRNIRKTGVFAINLDDNDDLICVKYTTGNEDLLIATRNGKSIRFNENDARPIGRTARGVKAITLKGDDTVIGMDVLKEGKTVLTISEIGNGKRCSVDKYSIQHRGGQGLKNYDINKYGHVCSIEVVNEEDDLIVLSSGGKIIRLAIADIKETSGRDSKGVKAMNLGDDEKVMMAVSVPKMEDEDIPEEESAQAEAPADENNSAE